MTIRSPTPTCRSRAHAGRQPLSNPETRNPSGRAPLPTAVLDPEALPEGCNPRTERRRLPDAQGRHPTRPPIGASTIRDRRNAPPSERRTRDIRRTGTTARRTGMTIGVVIM